MRRGVNKKSIAIIGEGETEWFYFDTLRTTKRYRFKLSPDIPAHPDLGNILRLALKYHQQEQLHLYYIKIIIFFTTDTVL